MATLILLVLGLAGCGAVVTPSPGATANPSPTTTAQPSAVATGSSPGATSAVGIDGGLLKVLPPTVDGLAVAENAEAEAAALDDPELPIVGTAMASGLAVDPTSGDFVYAIVVRLRPGAMTADVFRDWRDTYDEGACSQASGVAGNAEAQIDGRTVYIATCAGGVRTYHVWLDPQGMLISASAVGDDRRLGELLMNDLQVP